MTEESPDRYFVRQQLNQLAQYALVEIGILGKQIAERNKYPEMDGLDAIAWHLFVKRGLRPEYTKSLHPAALKFLLSDEREGWTIPGETPDEERDADYAIARLTALVDTHTEFFGDVIAEREDLQEDGREALEYYLCKRLGYRPDEVSVWSLAVIGRLLEPEIAAAKDEINRIQQGKNSD